MGSPPTWAYPPNFIPRSLKEWGEIAKAHPA